MAPVEKSLYLPSLDQTLNEQAILTWTSAYELLCRPADAVKSARLRDFLKTKESIECLRRWLNPLEPTTDAAKQARPDHNALIQSASLSEEDKQAAKQDAEWLVQITGLGGLEALRIVTLERIGRPAALLQSDAGDGGDLALQDIATQADQAKDSFSTSISSGSLEGPTSTRKRFHTQEARHQRLLKAYLSERLHVMCIGDLLRRLEDKDQGFLLGQETAPGWLIDISNSLDNNPPAKSADWWSDLHSFVTAAKHRLDRLESGCSWAIDGPTTPDLEEAWAWSNLAELNALFKSIYSVTSSHDTPLPSAAIREWLDFVVPYGFFKDMAPPFFSQSAAVALLQSLTAVISLRVLSIDLLDAIDAAISDDSAGALRKIEQSYLYSTASVGELQHIFLDTVIYGPSPATPALLAWSAFAMSIGELASASVGQRHDSMAYIGGGDPRSRRESLTADPETAIERVADVVRGSLVDADPIATLAAGAVDNCQAQDVVATVAGALESALSDSVDQAIQASARKLLLTLLDRTSDLTGYSGSLVASAIAVIGGIRRTWECGLLSRETCLSDAIADPGSLANRLKGEAYSRYPYEATPFLRFAKVACQTGRRGDTHHLQVTEQLQGMPSFTQVMPGHFQSYDLPREDEDPNVVRLLEDLPLFRLQRKAILGVRSRSMSRPTAETASRIPRGTEGIVINGGRPLITTWSHRHSAWQYLTNWLATAIAGCDWVDTAHASAIRLEDAGEIISLFASWLHTNLAAVEEGHNHDQARTDIIDLISSLRDVAHPDRDIVSIIFDVLEQQLHDSSVGRSREGSLDVLIAAMLFLSGIAQIYPGRVWAFLATSSLLELGNSGGALVAVVEASEMISGRYDFLIACTRLYEALIDDAFSNAISRRSSKSSRRFGGEEDLDAVPDRTRSAVLLGFTQALIGLFASSVTWRWSTSQDKAETNVSLMRAFAHLLETAYGFDDVSQDVNKPTAVLFEASRLLADVFLSGHDGDQTHRPALQVLFDSAHASSNNLTPKDRSTLVRQTIAALRLSRTLVSLSMLLKFPTSTLERRLFTITPVLTRTFCVLPQAQCEIISLLEIMVQSAVRSQKEPPSLLGHMGADAAKAFISVLTQEVRFSEVEAVKVAIWNLLSAVISCQQQWVAIYALTGTTAKEGLRSKTSVRTTMTGTLLGTALDIASNLSNLHSQTAVAILRFILLSSNYWPRALREIQKHTKFLGGILAFIGDLKRNPRERDLERLTRSCYETRMAGLIGEILTMSIHFSKQLGNFQIAVDVSDKLAYFKEFGVAPPRYNTSLHTNLERNLTAKYPGCRLCNFKRTSLLPSEFGEDFCYDLKFAARLLDFDPHWSREQSLRRELPLANVDLSLVEAQIELLDSWKLLAVELSSVCDKLEKVTPVLIGVVEKCLNANSNTDSPPIIFDRLVQTRADFAFELLQRLLQSSVPSTHLRPILSHVWDAVRASGVDFDAAFTGSGTDYHRSLLKVLYLALKPHAQDIKTSSASQAHGAGAAPEQSLSAQVSPSLPIVVEILGQVVALGFRSLATAVHESPTANLPSDFVTITAILQAVLAVHGIRAVTPQILVSLTSTHVIRYATSLFSWADQLAIPSTDGTSDPIYGELAILFLLELSSVPVVAETMAVEGLLAQLSASQITIHFQRPHGAGPFDVPARAFSIWSRGLLPLCLNLLGAVGAPLAAEVAAFLNQFAPQMARNAAALRSRTSPTRSTREHHNGLAPFAGAITLGMASETHSLSLLSFALDRAREAGASEGVVASDIPPLEWDSAAVREDLRVWLGGRRALAERIVAACEADEAMARAAPVRKGCENRLEERVVMELEGALLCLGGESGAAGQG